MSAPPPPALTEARQNRRFGLVVGGILLLGAAYHYLRHRDLPLGLLLAGGSLWLLAGLVPGRLTPLRRAWEWLGHRLGQVNTYVLLTLAYALVCVPLSGLLRLLGKDPLNRKWRPAAVSYWQQKEASGSFRRQF